jgi:Dirigent-like protein
VRGRPTVAVDRVIDIEEVAMRGRIRWIAPALIGAVAVVGAGGAIAPAAGPARTLDVVSVEQQCVNVDVGRKGASTGDQVVCHGVLRDAASNASVGHVRWTCAYLWSERAGFDCTGLASLDGGTLQLAGALSSTSAVSEWAVVGGTKAYAGSRGTVRLRQLSATRTAATISLLGEA